MEAFSEWARTHPWLVLASMVLGWLASIGALIWLVRTIRRGAASRRRHVARSLARWFRDHVVQLLSLLALPVLAFVLAQSYLDPSLDLRYDQLILVFLILGFAVLVQYPGLFADLLARITKAGPFEFSERQFPEIFSALEALPGVVDAWPSLGHPPEKPSKVFEYENAKADVHVALLESSFSLKKKAVESKEIQQGLFRLGAAALYKGDWVRAFERLELLLRISEGKFRPAETHYRCGFAYSYYAQFSWSEDAKDQSREDYFKKALDHFSEAVKADPYHWPSYFNMAFVQVDLRMYKEAILNNEKTIKKRGSYAPAKYNLVICYIKDKNLETALEKLKLIDREDEELDRVITATVIDKAGRVVDPELQPLISDKQQGPEAKNILRRLRAKASP